MNYVLFDGPNRDRFLPLCFTRPVADLRFGMLTIREKWEKYLRLTTTTLTEEYLESLYPFVEMDQNVFIDGSVCPSPLLVDAIHNLQKGQALYLEEKMLAFIPHDDEEAEMEEIDVEFAVLHVKHLHELYSKNAEALEADYDFLTEDEISEDLSASNTLLGSKGLFLEEGVRMEACTLNTTEGPIYIANDAQVMEGAHLRGPLYIGPHSKIKMGSTIYGGTTIGPYCSVGGEVDNSIFWGYSNKAHNGFLGNSVIGQWCNLGAGTISSNLGNDYKEARQWSYDSKSFAPTGQQFCGLVMADHSKSGIGTLFNSATVVGVCCNIYGAGFPRNFISSFQKGGAQGLVPVRPKLLREGISTMMARRGEQLSDDEYDILVHIHSLEVKKVL